MFVEALILFLLGAATGSFLMVVVERFDTAESFWVGRSHCNHCKKKLTALELIPILGYILIGGKCVQCKKQVPAVYPVLEAVTGAVFVGLGLAALKPVNYFMLLLEVVFASSLLLIAYYDWFHRAFPLAFITTSFGILVILLLAQHWLGSPYNNQVVVMDPLFGWLSSPTNALRSAVWGGVVGAGFLALLSVPSKGKWMGYGDVLLGGVLGLWLGYPFIIAGLLLAFYAGALIGVWKLYVEKVKDHRIAFGPFLILAALASQVWGQALFRAIMTLWGIT